MPNNYNSTHKFHELACKHSFNIDYLQMFNHKNLWTQCGPCGKTKPQELKNNQTHNKLWHHINLIGNQRKNTIIYHVNSNHKFSMTQNEGNYNIEKETWNLPHLWL